MRLGRFAHRALAQDICMDWHELKVRTNTNRLSSPGLFRHTETGVWPHDCAGGQFLCKKPTKLSPHVPSAMLVLRWLEYSRNSQLTFSVQNINTLPLTAFSG